MEEKLHKTTEAQRKAVYKYDDKFERVNCRFQKGTKKRISDLGYTSINGYVKMATMDRLERDEKAIAKAHEKQ